MEPKAIVVAVSSEPREYFCRSCGQLRLCLVQGKADCGNCGSSDLVFGKPGELDKQALMAARSTK